MAYRAARILLSVSLAAGVATPAVAGEFSISLGAGVAPQYRGADEYRLIPMPGFSWEGETFSVKTSRLGLEADLVPGRGFAAGPILRYSFGRDPGDIDDPVVALLPEIDAAVQAGGYASAAIPLGDPSTNPLFLTLRGEAVQALGGEQGLTAEFSAGILARMSPVTLGVAATLAWADGEHMDTFFGVTPAASAASGLPAFDPGAGISEWGVEAFAGYELNENWSVSAFGKWSRLTGDAADSPIVSVRGDADQFFAGASLRYTFR